MQQTTGVTRSGRASGSPPIASQHACSPQFTAGRREGQSHSEMCSTRTAESCPCAIWTRRRQRRGAMPTPAGQGNRDGQARALRWRPPARLAGETDDGLFSPTTTASMVIRSTEIPERMAGKTSMRTIDDAKESERSKTKRGFASMDASKQRDIESRKKQLTRWAGCGSPAMKRVSPAAGWRSRQPRSRAPWRSVALAAWRVRGFAPSRVPPRSSCGLRCRLRQPVICALGATTWKNARCSI